MEIFGDFLDEKNANKSRGHFKTVSEWFFGHLWTDESINQRLGGMEGGQGTGWKQREEKKKEANSGSFQNSSDREDKSSHSRQDSRKRWPQFFTAAIQSIKARGRTDSWPSCKILESSATFIIFIFLQRQSITFRSSDTILGYFQTRDPIPRRRPGYWRNTTSVISPARRGETRTIRRHTYGLSFRFLGQRFLFDTDYPSPAFGKLSESKHERERERQREREREREEKALNMLADVRAPCRQFHKVFRQTKKVSK